MFRKRILNRIFANFFALDFKFGSPITSKWVQQKKMLAQYPCARGAGFRIKILWFEHSSTKCKVFFIKIQSFIIFLNKLTIPLLFTWLHSVSSFQNLDFEQSFLSQVCTILTKFWQILSTHQILPSATNKFYHKVIFYAQVTKLLTFQSSL